MYAACFASCRTWSNSSQHTTPQAPHPISVVNKIEESKQWGGVNVQIPFEAANDTLGKALSCEVFTAAVHAHWIDDD